MKRTLSPAVATLVAGGAVVLAASFSAAATAAPAKAELRGQAFSHAGLDAANPRDGVVNNRIADGLSLRSVAWGSLPLVNPDAANGVTHYGYNTSNITADGALTQGAKEAFKTEPDKNVYLTFGGKHYLYQGHEMGPRGYVTRIDLDEKDPLKRVSLVTDVDVAGKAFPTIDGITWDPFSRQLLITAEGAGLKGGVWAIGLDDKGEPTSKAVPLPALGQGGYEGIQNDADGNVWIVEDTGGAAVDGGKAPHTYVYRFVPTDKADLTKGGTLQALVVEREDHSRVTADVVEKNPNDPFLAELHTVGKEFDTHWIEVHRGTTEVFDAPVAAAKAGATPFKRPENGVFRPGTDFREFWFTETGDTTTKSTLPGAYGGVFRLTMEKGSADRGRITLAIPGDKEHTGFDNIAFAGKDTLLVVEDAGDSLHEQRNALDSGYAFDLSGGHKAPAPVRWLAEGRDASATFDALGGPKYNDGDNEITGIHVSDGDPGVGGLLGAKDPKPGKDGWRVFWTQQHGDNVTWEVLGGER